MADEQKKKSNAATRFKPGNAHRFEAGGESPNPGGAKSKYRLYSKALRERLSARAPDAVTKSLHIKRGASWAMCLATTTLNDALRGDAVARQLVASLTGDNPRALLEIGAGFDEETGQMVSGPPLLEVAFVSNEFSRASRERGEGMVETDSQGRVIKGPLPPRLIEAHLQESDVDPVPSPEPDPVQAARARPNPDPRGLGIVESSPERLKAIEATRTGKNFQRFLSGVTR